ncbi:hypothetical protein [Geodermatophilus sp. SYSU D00079]
MSCRPDAGDVRTTRERMLAGDPYPADAPEPAEANGRALGRAAAHDATTVRQAPLRRRLLELLGAIGADSVVGAGAVAIRDLLADVVAVGTPARVVRTVDAGAR